LYLGHQSATFFGNELDKDSKKQPRLTIAAFAEFAKTMTAVLADLRVLTSPFSAFTAFQ
jgi:hypothetical protein